uniref:Carboxylesterase type B domain-containing protein n=1 Tax=Octopus bimaculoides TaxID=37653 RepID=A0A0L8G3I5_OCTBM
MGGSLTSPFIGSACVSILLVVLVLNIGECVVYMRTLSDRVVTTRYGTVRGVMVEFPNRHLKPVDAYLGLPYASLLRGNLRFMPPTSPMEKWTGTRVVLDMSPVCPQKVPDLNDLKGKVPESRYEHYKRIAPLLSKQLEDCLSLNLYVPRQGKSEVLKEKKSHTHTHAKKNNKTKRKCINNVSLYYCYYY